MFLCFAASKAVDTKYNNREVLVSKVASYYILE